MPIWSTDYSGRPLLPVSFFPPVAGGKQGGRGEATPSIPTGSLPEDGGRQTPDVLPGS